LGLLREQYEIEEKLAKLHGKDASEEKTALRNRKALIKHRLEEAEKTLSEKEHIGYDFAKDILTDKHNKNTDVLNARNRDKDRI
jgi:hypothetical protein